MELLTLLGVIGLGALILLAAYAATAMLLLAAAIQLAARQEHIPRSDACRTRRHSACPGCGCSHHN